METDHVADSRIIQINRKAAGSFESAADAFLRDVFLETQTEYLLFEIRVVLNDR